MASIDKVKVGETTYDVSPSSTGTLSGYTSNDNVTPPPPGVKSIQSLLAILILLSSPS